MPSNGSSAPQALPTQPKSGKTEVDEPPRVRYAKREIAKVLTALENVKGSELALALRVIDLEEQLADTREQAARWRRCFESMRDIANHSGPNGDLKRLEQAMRSWVGKA